MKPQYDNKVLSSFLLWFDNKLLKKGEGFTNHSSAMFDMSETISYGGSYNTYGAPFKQFVYDEGIAGSNMFTGITVTDSVSGTNTYPLSSAKVFSLNPTEGQVTLNLDEFAGTIQAVTGDYSIKEFSVKMATEPEEKLLFETKYSVKPVVDQSITTGMQVDEESFPVVFLLNNGSMNEPGAFGGHDFTSIDIRAVVLSDSRFSLDAIFSIFRDSKKENFFLFDENEMPFNFAGSYKDDVTFDYTGVVGGTNLGGPKGAFIDEVTVASQSTSDLNELQDIDTAVFAGIIDFEVRNLREPRC
tara:strand:- start:473 stop:1372 length:900 start_codon:yes stop_codon:yes gene_type:complete